MKLNLVDSKSDRNFAMSKASEGRVNLVEMLKKYGEVVDYMTSDMVANLYKIDKELINWYGTNKKEELEKYGYRVYKKSEILNVASLHLENIPNRGLRLYPIKSVIVIGMMLTESEVAEHLRKDIIDILFNEDRGIGYKVVTGEGLHNLRTTHCSLQISSKTRSLKLKDKMSLT